MVERHVLVVETPEFRKQAKTLFAAADVAAIRLFVAENPTVGVIMRGTGGVRKLRWALPGRGKRGGARVIYFYYDDSIPVYLFGAYGKSRRESLSHAERNALK